MGKETDIQWSDSTVNPTENCTGCELWDPNRGIKVCYAGRLTERWHGLGAFDKPIALKPGRMTEASLWPDLRGHARPDKPWIPKEMPRLIFVSDMSDALCGSVSFEYLDEEIIKTAQIPPGNRHVWIWCTKRPARMAAFSSWLQGFGRPWPSNIWVLTSVTDQKHAQLRIPWLMQVGDADTVRGISAEPLWGPVQLDQVKALERESLDWIITGGESGRNNTEGTLDRIADLVSQAEDWDTPCFVKQMGTDPAWSDRKGGDWSEWPTLVQVRQFPCL
jgi:protein gp37